ncbi:MAG TPA: hypothetical protein VF094_00620 [Gaiellaceae bacterium]
MAPLRCRLTGHRLRFRAQGATMSWACERCAGAAGEKHYASPADASRYAAAFDREDRSDLGRRAPLVGLLPLRVWRIVHDRRAARRR